jgi:signal transduction histidine kinase
MQRLLRPRLEMPRLGLPAFRRRILVRGVFLLLALATVVLSVVVLKEEKERAWHSYQHGFVRSQAEVMARLRHPSGQLALLNAGHQAQDITPLTPLLLPYAAIDFDDQNKSQQAVEMAGCAVQYPDQSSVCVAVGNNPYAGGFIYVVGSFYAGALTARERGALALQDVHRARVTLEMRGATHRWIAPYEAMAARDGSTAARGRLAGFVDSGAPQLGLRARPVRDFRGWLWQNGQCRDLADRMPECLRRTFYSIRLPVELFREALFHKGARPVWPPEDLDHMQVRVEMLAPGDDATPPLFDSNAPGARLAASLSDISRALQPGEQVQIRRLDAGGSTPITLKGPDPQEEPTAPWLIRLIGWLPLTAPDTRTTTPEGLDLLDTPTGHYDVRFIGNLRGVEQGLAAVATRMSWYLGAMLTAIALAWLLIEVGLIRRVTALTRRAAAVSYNVQPGHTGPRLGDLDVSDLRGPDELGILAGGLADLLQRVKDDTQREQLRAQQERDMWHAVGHEIMSPLQSLMVLHGDPEDPSRRYVQRMQQAVHVLYGTASPAEALQAADLPQGRLDLDAFLRHVAANAHFADIADVVYEGSTHGPVIVRADEFALEDVVTHILRNATRHRPAGTPIQLTLAASASTASATLHNQGSTIAEDLLERIFELGVTDPGTPTRPGDGEHRGQGLFVAKTYMAKMGGAISAHNTADGVAFTLTFQRLG